MSYTYQYPRPAVCADAIIVAKENGSISILLIKRKNNPYKGKWALPGGFVDMDEDLPDACMRELKEETGLEGIALHQFASFGKPGRDPRGRTISVVYWGIIYTKLTLSANDDAAEAQWFELNSLPPLAFDHQKIIEKFLADKTNLFSS
ncbi:MAG: NUDIX hydrolase [Prolixibacteraceae bacterium]|nr:NUDIX hydrolase [Prolixibacteraceae bacterium]MBN2650683.1 NUDIX hydrolase [Prolixibacteraceae bacterium]